MLQISEDTKKIFADAVDACANVTHPPMDAKTMESAMNHGNLNEIYSPFVFCVYKKVGIFNDKFDINQDMVIKFLKNISDDADKNEEVAGVCARKKSTPEETSLFLFNCVAQHLH